jgi:hypothetical protein
VTSFDEVKVIGINGLILFNQSTREKLQGRQQMAKPPFFIFRNTRDRSANASLLDSGRLLAFGS